VPFLTWAHRVVDAAVKDSKECNGFAFPLGRIGRGWRWLRIGSAFPKEKSLWVGSPTWAHHTGCSPSQGQKAVGLLPHRAHDLHRLRCLITQKTKGRNQAGNNTRREERARTKDRRKPAHSKCTRAARVAKSHEGGCSSMPGRGSNSGSRRAHWPEFPRELHLQGKKREGEERLGSTPLKKNWAVHAWADWW
jgi:hypothetical protein